MQTDQNDPGANEEGTDYSQEELPADPADVVRRWRQRMQRRNPPYMTAMPRLIVGMTIIVLLASALTCLIAYGLFFLWKLYSYEFLPGLSLLISIKIVTGLLILYVLIGIAVDLRSVRTRISSLGGYIVALAVLVLVQSFIWRFETTLRNPPQVVKNSLVSGAILSGEDKDVVDLLDEGAVPTYLPFQAVAKRLSDKTVRRIIDAVPTDGKDYANAMLLHYAATNLRADLIPLLIERGADVNTDRYSDAPLLCSTRDMGYGRGDRDWAEREAARLQVISILLEYGALPNATRGSYDGRTCLHNVADGGTPEEIELLLKYGGDPNLKDDEGQTPADIAAKRPDGQKIVDLLRTAAATRPATTQSGG